MRHPFNMHPQDAKAIMVYAAIGCAIAMIALLNGCGKVPAPSVLLTETRGGEEIRMQEPTPTGPRTDIPAGVLSSDVVSHNTFSHAGGAQGKITTVKETHWRFWASKTEVYYNCDKCHGAGKVALPMHLKSETPKAPWYKYPVYFLAILIAALMLYFIRPLIALLKSLVDFMGRLKK